MHKILKHNKFYLYKMRHELNGDDFNQRVQFCETMMTKIDTKPDFLSNISLFTEEITVFPCKKLFLTVRCLYC